MSLRAVLEQASHRLIIRLFEVNRGRVVVRLPDVTAMV